jgi:hypothetical protein
MEPVTLNGPEHIQPPLLSAERKRFWILDGKSGIRNFPFFPEAYLNRERLSRDLAEQPGDFLK